jgi:hypothetical protein
MFTFGGYDSKTQGIPSLVLGLIASDIKMGPAVTTDDPEQAKSKCSLAIIGKDAAGRPIRVKVYDQDTKATTCNRGSHLDLEDRAMVLVNAARRVAATNAVCQAWNEDERKQFDEQIEIIKDNMIAAFEALGVKAGKNGNVLDKKLKTEFPCIKLEKDGKKIVGVDPKAKLGAKKSKKVNANKVMLQVVAQLSLALKETQDQHYDNLPQDKKYANALLVESNSGEEKVKGSSTITGMNWAYAIGEAQTNILNDVRVAPSENITKKEADDINANNVQRGPMSIVYQLSPSGEPPYTIHEFAIPYSSVTALDKTGTNGTLPNFAKETTSIYDAEGKKVDEQTTYRSAAAYVKDSSKPHAENFEKTKEMIRNEFRRYFADALSDMLANNNGQVTDAMIAKCSNITLNRMNLQSPSGDEYYAVKGMMEAYASIVADGTIDLGKVKEELLTRFPALGNTLDNVKISPKVNMLTKGTNLKRGRETTRNIISGPKDFVLGVLTPSAFRTKMQRDSNAETNQSLYEDFKNQFVPFVASKTEKGGTNPVFVSMAETIPQTTPPLEMVEILDRLSKIAKILDKESNSKIDALWASGDKKNIDTHLDKISELLKKCTDKKSEDFQKLEQQYQKLCLFVAHFDLNLAEQRSPFSLSYGGVLASTMQTDKNFVGQVVALQFFEALARDNTDGIMVKAVNCASGKDRTTSVIAMEKCVMAELSAKGSQAFTDLRQGEKSFYNNVWNMFPKVIDRTFGREVQVLNMPGARGSNEQAQDKYWHAVYRGKVGLLSGFAHAALFGKIHKVPFNKLRDFDVSNKPPRVAEESEVVGKVTKSKTRRQSSVFHLANEMDLESVTGSKRSFLPSFFRSQKELSLKKLAERNDVLTVSKASEAPVNEKKGPGLE